MEDLKLALIQKIINCNKMEILLECDKVFKKYYNIHFTDMVSEPEYLYETKKNLKAKVVENLDEEFYILSESMQKMVDLSLEDVKKGRVFTEEEIDKMDQETIKNEEEIILPPQIIEILKMSEEQINSGKSYTNKEVEKYFAEWLEN